MNLRTVIALWVLAIASPSQAASAEPAADAHALVSASLAAMDRGVDLRKTERIGFGAKILSRDLVEGEHAGEPYVVSFGAAAITYDLASGYRRILSKGADGGVVRQELTVGSADELAAVRDGVVGTRGGGLAPPAWEARDPFHALLLADRAADLRLEPDVAIHANSQHVVSFSLRGVRVRVFIDAGTRLVTAAETRPVFSHATSADIASNAMGDVTERTEFQLWEDAGGLRYPTQWDTYRNDTLWLTVRLDGTLSVNGPWAEADRLAPGSLKTAADLAATDLSRIALGHPIWDGPDPKHGTEEIAPGVVQIPGSWFATLVRQDDGIVVIDAPISAGYSAEVIAEAGRRFPGVPIKAVITSTAFFWHVGGVREYAARHIPIYVRDANLPTLKRILLAPRHLAPDRLALNGMRPILRPISRRTVIGRGGNRIVVMPIAQATEPMLMTYIPDARLLHTAEMIQPLGPGGAFTHPESLLEIRDAVRAEGLQVDRLIGMHMTPRPWAVLEAAIAASGA